MSPNSCVRRATTRRSAVRNRVRRSTSVSDRRSEDHERHGTMITNATKTTNTRNTRNVDVYKTVIVRYVYSCVSWRDTVYAAAEVLYRVLAFFDGHLVMLAGVIAG